MNNLLIRFLKSRLRGLLLRALILLLGFKVALRIIPFAKLRKWIPKCAQTSSGTQQYTAEQIAYAVKAVGQYVWPDRACLPEALTAYVLLRQQGYAPQLQIGVRQLAHNKIIGHAWVELNQSVLVGYGSTLSQFTKLPQIMP